MVDGYAISEHPANPTDDENAAAIGGCPSYRQFWVCQKYSACVCPRFAWRDFAQAYQPFSSELTRSHVGAAWLSPSERTAHGLLHRQRPLGTMAHHSAKGISPSAMHGTGFVKCFWPDSRCPERDWSHRGTSVPDPSLVIKDLGDVMGPDFVGMRWHQTRRQQHLHRPQRQCFVVPGGKNTNIYEYTKICVCIYIYIFIQIYKYTNRCNYIYSIYKYTKIYSNIHLKSPARRFFGSNWR